MCFFWALAIPSKLNRQARDLLSNKREGLFLSAASSWEISLKFELGKLELPEPPVKYIPKWMLNWGIRGLDISHLHALAVGDLPLRHQDPFDRILIVQAVTEGMVLLTADRNV
ncbi:MAG: type II toxin-antitoxin system VapC family toxin [Candidatus Acidiferrales bacterium]